MLSASAQRTARRSSLASWLGWLLFLLTHPGTVEIVTTPRPTYLYAADRRKKTRRLQGSWTITPTREETDRRAAERRAGRELMQLQGVRRLVTI